MDLRFRVDKSKVWASLWPVLDYSLVRRQQNLLSSLWNQITNGKGAITGLDTRLTDAINVSSKTPLTLSVLNALKWTVPEKVQFPLVIHIRANNSVSKTIFIISLQRRIG